MIGLLESLTRRKDKIIEDLAEDRIERVAEIDAEMLHLIGTLPSRLEMLERPSTCDVRVKYEVVIMSIKNRLLGVQAEHRKRKI